jgi:hypothetical protein
MPAQQMQAATVYSTAKLFSVPYRHIRNAVTRGVAAPYHGQPVKVNRKRRNSEFFDLSNSACGLTFQPLSKRHSGN